MKINISVVLLNKFKNSGISHSRTLNDVLKEFNVLLMKRCRDQVRGRLRKKDVY